MATSRSCHAQPLAPALRRAGREARLRADADPEPHRVRRAGQQAPVGDLLDRNYADRDFYDPRGRYGDVRWLPVALMVLGTAIGWGLVTNTSANWLKWQGYLLGPFGLGGKNGAWAFANLGVVVALAIAFGGWLLGGRPAVQAQEDAAAPEVTAGVTAP